ncbi:uncharacterized protein LOC132311994 isoform X2 [Cornus florida]|uniref:uncharacterized protein LOC132311994 isoform X2 n=2 Tax=Cornus florida TaxID=4283 RepID=UPI002897D3F0|nr:uncharacterized protein LOC132311994 isoform X2 [Cornus florida]
MVGIQVKHGGGGGGGDGDQKEFLYECSSTSTIDDIAKDVTGIANLQSEIHHLLLRLQPRLSDSLLRDHKVLPLMRALSEAKSYASKDQVPHNRPLSYNVLKDHIQSIEREFSVNYQALDFQDCSLRQLLPDLELLQEDRTQLWWAGKQLLRGNQLCDYIGKNEKTKIIVRLQSPVSPPECN